MPIAVEELRAAGLWDPAAPDADERLAMLQWLVERGATLDQLRRAAGTGAFPDLATELGRGDGPRFTLAELSARTGVAAERIQATRFAAGLPPVGADEPVLIEEDALAVSALETGERLFGEEPLRRFTQVLGTSLARIAEAAISLFLVNVESPVRRSGGELALVQARFRGAETSRPLIAAVGYLFRAHLQAAGRRMRRVYRSSDTACLATGFVDLVGFTTLSRRVEPEVLARIIERFEEAAHDAATAHDGRVVKFVGDEVMFVAEDATAACRIALALVERFAGDPSVTPRGGIAYGDVLVRAGDYYGPVVNLAARLVEHAVPSEVLVTEPVAGAVVDQVLRFVPAGRRVLKGFDAPVAVMTAMRAGEA